ncbi:MAG: hypothetical protein U1F35_21570 [Steroidobacteraceae bacterium]
MNRTQACILALLLGVAAPALQAIARVPVTLIEASVETTADDLSLPANESGIITAHSCPTCSLQTFYFAPEHLLILGGRPASLKEMTDALRHAGKAAVTVHYRRADQRVTRIVLAMMPAPESAQ